MNKKITRSELYKCGFRDSFLDLSDVCRKEKVKPICKPLYFFKEYYDSELGGEITINLIATKVKKGRKHIWMFFEKINNCFFTKNLYDVLNQYSFIEWKKDIGFVYILKKEGENVYKIGKTKNIKNRNTFFKINIPFEFDIIKIFGSSKYSLLERKIHQYLKEEDKHNIGEWFNLSETDIRRIYSYYENFQKKLDEEVFYIEKRILDECFN